ncbi:hypothetical protein H5C74_23160 (plasmid) [Escherichia coli]|nr:hypothetical protein [Escherichia coli]QNC17511.1 hypothetical protein H5C74_23160 [Escherichia coli]
MIHIGEEGAQKTDTSNLQGNAQVAPLQLAMRQPFVLFKGLTFQNSAYQRIAQDHHNKNAEAPAFA